MGIISSSRRQNAIYWPPGRVDGFGRPTSGVLVELVITSGSNYRVRWEDTVEDFLDAAGTTQLSKALVYVPLLPDGTEVQTGGFLWLGDRSDLADSTVPLNNPKAYEVRRFDKLPNLRATEILRTAYL